MLFSHQKTERLIAPPSDSDEACCHDALEVEIFGASFKIKRQVSIATDEQKMAASGLSCGLFLRNKLRR
jgi:hypothetical protein